MTEPHAVIERVWVIGAAGGWRWQWTIRGAAKGWPADMTSGFAGTRWGARRKARRMLRQLRRWEQTEPEVIS